MEHVSPDTIHNILSHAEAEVMFISRAEENLNDVPGCGVTVSLGHYRSSNPTTTSPFPNPNKITSGSVTQNCKQPTRERTQKGEIA